MKARELISLRNNDVLTAKVSDHHPIVHSGVLFWNIMMQAKTRPTPQGIGYNNGFGLTETEASYNKRLIKVATVIAETVSRNNSIEAIALCEGPIQPEQVNTLLQTLKSYPVMQRFFANSVIEDKFHQPSIPSAPNWGLLMLADKKYQINKIETPALEDARVYEKLANRFQLWELQSIHEKKYLALAHFPFGGDEEKINRKQFSRYGKLYANIVNEILKEYADQQLIFCADFNFNPHLINQFSERVSDKIKKNNSIVLKPGAKSGELQAKPVTVDGILLSSQGKQRYVLGKFHAGLFNRLSSERELAKPAEKDFLIANRHKDARLQGEYDRRFGLACQRVIGLGFLP